MQAGNRKFVEPCSDYVSEGEGRDPSTNGSLGVGGCIKSGVRQATWRCSTTKIHILNRQKQC